MNKIPVISIVGPTASGKTGIAIDLAKEINGEIISADSMQIYKGMDIATAKPTKEEMQGIKHHLIDFVDVDRKYSVADFVKDAKECISDIYSGGKIPILVGGTGLYVDTLINNIQLAETENNYELRETLRKRAEEEGGEKLLDELMEIDPETAVKLHKNNVGRIIRALEIYYTSGIKMSEQVKNSHSIPSPYDSLMIGLNFEDREKLYNRINLRVDKMLEDGLLKEAENYIKLNSSNTSSQAIGYKELKPYFDGEISLETAVENLKMETRRYAKRQLTWFRRNENVNWFYLDRYDDIKSAEDEMKNLIKDFLKEKE